MKTLAFTFIIALCSVSSNGQTVITQDFEGPLTGWYNEGTLTGLENSISPYAGAGMLSLSSNEDLETPYFNLPAGPKYMSFWMNAYNPYSVVSFQIEVELLQNGNSAMMLATYTDLVGWDQKGITIPAGFTGNDFTVRFHVLNYSSSYSNLRFYLDDINVISGTPAGFKENHIDQHLFVGPNPVSEKLSVKNESAQPVELYNMIGELLFSSKEGALEIDMSAYPKGIYLLKSGSNAKRIIKN